MTIFGKILVFVNLALSFVMLAWALGVYTESTDWYTPKATTSPEKAQGELFKLRDRIAPQGGFGLWDAVKQAEGRLKVSNAAVAAVEAPRDSKQKWDTVRAENQRWYAEQLKNLDTSVNPVSEVVRKEKEGDLVLDDKHPGRPLMQEAKDKGGKPLMGMAVYAKELVDTNVQIKDAMNDLNKFIAEDADLTAQIGGPKGLRVRLANEEEKRLRVLSEQDYLKPQLVNSQVEEELLLKRQRQLEARKAELMQQGGVAER
jgi:hypothetical protein